MLNDFQRFSSRDEVGGDKWTAFTPTFTSLTVVGATSYSGRHRKVGRLVEFQVQLSAATSIASTAGTTYMSLPTTCKGIAGLVAMTNKTTNVSVGLGHIDTTNSRCYLPTQAASGNVFTIFGSYEAE